MTGAEGRPRQKSGRVHVGSTPITGNGFGSGFEPCPMPVSLEEGTYPATIRKFVASDDRCMHRVLDKAESAGHVASGFRRAIAKLYPKNRELHVKREGCEVFVYKMMMGDD